MVDPLDFSEADDLLQFFHRHKTEMSCMEKPYTFLSQLRDHDLVSDDKFEKVSRMKSKDNMKRGLYDILDCLERKQPQKILVFWKCVFKDTIINNYPTLRLLRNSLMDGSYRDETQLPEQVEKKETDERKRKEVSEDEDEEDEEEEQRNSVKKKRKHRRRSASDDEEQQPGPSSQSTPASPLKKGEKNDFWNWPLYKHQLPVTCGQKKGSLSKDRMAKGEECILFEKQWLTPNEFEKLAGKGSSKNWKLSIRCMGTPLRKLIKKGHLKSQRYKRRHKKQAQRPLFPSNDPISVSDEEEEEDEDEDHEDDSKNHSSSDEESSTDVTDEDGETDGQTEPGVVHDTKKRVFEVTCGNVTATLHQKRFASGTHGKSIRTETGWLSPMEFVTEASSQTDATWKKDIKVDGQPLSALIEEEILSIHSPLCCCTLCSPDRTELEDQKNDDECFICKKEEAVLVECDYCPRSFHKKCHLPRVDDAILEDDRPWMCTFCVTTQEWRYSGELEMNAAMSRRISQHMLECQYLLLCLYSADEEQTFASDPSLYLENYSTVIQTPMWLDNVADKLQKKEYQTVGEFVSDIQLIFTNCASYNSANAEFLALGGRLKELFSAEFKKVFNIREQSVD